MSARRPRDHAVLVRANADADPVLRALNTAALPWRFSGTSGLYARPEVRLLLALLRAVADTGSSVDVFALAASDRYAIPAGDLGEVAGSARRRHRSLFEVLEELEDEPASLRISPRGRPPLAQLTGDLRRYRELAQRRPAGEVLYAFLRDTGWLAELAGATSLAAEEQLANIGRFFDIIRTQSALLADDRAVFLARHLGTLIEAGDDPPTADPDPDVDAVHVMTVHKAKGLEFPVVFLPGLVAGPVPGALTTRAARPADRARRRGPARGRRPPAGGAAPVLRRHDPCARRADPEPQQRVRGRSCPAPVAVRHRGAGPADRRLQQRIVPIGDACRGPAGPHRRRRAAGGRPGRGAPADRRAAHAQPLGDRRLPDMPAPVQVRAGRARPDDAAPLDDLRRGAPQGGPGVPSVAGARHAADASTELLAVFDAAWSNEGFISREHETARLEAGRDALRRFRESQLQPGTVVPAWVEREFAFALGGDRVRGRFDRVDIVPVAAPSAEVTGATPTEQVPSVLRADVIEPMLELLGPEEVTITDYKSSDVRDPAVAKQRARDSLQLQIYAMAYEAMTGRLPDAVQLHFLDSGLVGRAEVEPARLEKARAKIATAAAGIRARDYTPKPGALACTYCPFRDICPSSVAR